MTPRARRRLGTAALTAALCVLAALFLLPVALVLINSFKSRFSISGAPFALPNAATFVGWENYRTGLSSGGFFAAFLRSAFITVASVVLIVLCTSMAAWYLARVSTRATRAVYAVLVSGMIVPFQMVMFTVTFVVGQLGLNNVVGIVPVYLGFGAGLSVFLFTGFARDIPRSLEEAAVIDGCSPPACFFRVVLPVMRPVTVTVAILNAMWIWNDYLLPYLVLGTRQKTVPVTIQLSMQGAYGSTDYGGLMAMLVLAIVPIVAFYLAGQKHIVEGVLAGAVKG